MGERMTLKQWIEVLGDLDGYVARGGQLLDLEVINPEQLPQQVQMLIRERLGPEQINRLGLYCRRVAMHAAADQPVGERCTEEVLRSIWRETAAPTSEAAR
jgi:hypothetical protein